MKKELFIAVGFLRVMLFAVAITALSACAKSGDNSYTGDGESVNLRVQASATANPNDIDNYVSTLRIFAVDLKDGYIISNVFFNTEQVEAGNFTMPVKQTRLRLYFIANEKAEMTTELDKVLTEKELITQGGAIEDIFLPDFVPSASSPFIMSAKVDVEIPESWNPDNTFVVQEPVSFVRVPAKLTFSLKKDFENIISGSGSKQYRAVVELLGAEVIRVPAKHRILTDGSAYTGELFAYKVNLERKTGGEYLNNDRWTDVYHSVFVPEHIVVDNDPNLATVIAVRLRHSMVRVGNNNQTFGDPSEKTFYVPIQTEVGGCNLFRNNHYVVNCLLKGWTDDIYAKTEVMPWEKEYVDVDFDKPNYELVPYVELKDPEKGNPIITTESPNISYGFCLKGPKGANWKASLTNGRHFTFTGSEYGYTAPDTFVNISIKAVFPWEEGLPFIRSTDLVITINDKETIRIKDITQVG